MKRFLVRTRSSCDSNDRYEVFDTAKHCYVGEFSDESYAQFIANTLNEGLEAQ